MDGKLESIVAASWEKYLKFRCTGCGNCCRDTIVCINDEDVRQIVLGTGKTPQEFVRFFTPDEIAMSRHDPLWLRFDSAPAVMGLRKIHDRCLFLDPQSNRCTIYEYRPVTCRDHPVNVAFSDSGAVVKMWLSRIVECPHAWDGKITKRELRRLQTLNQRHEKLSGKSPCLESAQKRSAHEVGVSPFSRLFRLTPGRGNAFTPFNARSRTCPILKKWATPRPARSLASPPLQPD